jgi:hypothetical protein
MLPFAFIYISFVFSFFFTPCYYLYYKPVHVKDIYADPFLVERSFIITGSYGLVSGFVSFVDFSEVIDRECQGMKKEIMI